MTNLFSRMFGGAAPATSDAIRARLDETRAALARNAERIAAAEAALAEVAVMTEGEHRAADEELGEARREGVRLVAQVAGLGEVLAATEKAEADAALQARRAELLRRVEVDAPKALADYEKACVAVAAAAGTVTEIELEVREFNEGLPRDKRGLALETPERKYRTTPGEFRPEKRERREVWKTYDHHSGAWMSCVMTVDADGKRVPAQAGAKSFHEEVVVERARERDPVALPPLASELKLPPARAGAAQLWPKPKA